MLRIISRLLLLTAALTATATAPGLAAEAADRDEEQRGAELLGMVANGGLDCGDIDNAEFDAIGELVMGRMLGSPRIHGAMDQMMARTMGAGGLAGMHEFMGQRLSGCGAPAGAASYGGTLGLMQMMGGGAGGRMGGPDGRPGTYGPGAMMGGGAGLDDDDNDGSGAWMVIVMLAGVVAAGVAVFAIARPRRRGGRGPTPLDVLGARFARGDLSVEDYEQRRRLLEGGR